MATQIIKREGVPEYAVIPYSDYQKLLKLAEDADDIAFAEAAKDDENIPSEIVYQLLDGENPLKVWRKFRGMTQTELAEKADVTQAMITMIENGKRTGTIDVLSRLAKVLNIDIDDLTD